MIISTKKGDGGKTKLMFNREVSKFDPRVCAYGAIDDFAATLGLARAFAKGTKLADFLKNIQEKTVFLMTELATSNDDHHFLVEKNMRLINEDDLKELEVEIDRIEKDKNTFMGWTHSGETPLQAALDMARSRCRAAEREIARLDSIQPLPRRMPMIYVNRLSDLVWLLAQESLKQNS